MHLVRVLVSGKILGKPGKQKSGRMKDQRIIVIQPLCTCINNGNCMPRKIGENMQIAHQ